MKKIVFVAIVSALSFLAGLIVNFSSQARVTEASKQIPFSSSGATASPAPCPQGDEFPKLIEDKYVTKFNGIRLKLDYDAAFISDDLPFSINSAKVTALRDGGLIVSIGDTLVRFNSQRQVVWQNPFGQIIFDHAYVESTNLIYGTASDNIMFVMDALDGTVLSSETRNGSAWYGVAEAYGDDMCLVTDNFRWYRQRDWVLGAEPMKDGITCWRGTQKLWRQDFPPDAELVVKGKRILAVTKSKQAIYVNEIIPPQTNSE